MSKQYTSELEGQREFYQQLHIDPDLHHNTDGIDRGNLYENKLCIDNINKVLFQAIKYASRIRIRGEKLPSQLILNDLNAEKCYIFQSLDLLKDIEKVYYGAASKDNNNYTSSAKYKIIDYSNIDGLSELLEFAKNETFTKYHVDKTNIYGLSRCFYKNFQDKDRLLKGKDAEIRKPVVLNDRILPYAKEDNIEFEDIMDCLNPNLLQREQGAFYTPQAYVDKMHEMLYKAIENIPEGYDYVIIDRCAGVGNLEEGLSAEILEHCILSTIEYNEYQILQYKFADKCSVVVPALDTLAYDIIPSEADLFGHVISDEIRERINNPECVVILMENPPFSEAGSGAIQNTGKKDNLWKRSYIIKQMKDEIKGVATNELSNLFIWSGFKYYLTKPIDSYILYSPTKYWRNQNLVNKKFMAGFFCNRKEFHAEQNSAMACIWWQNVDDTKTEELTMTPYNIENDCVVRATDDITIRKAYHNLSEAYDNRNFKDDEQNGIICECNGLEFEQNGRNTYEIGKYNPNIIAYLDVHSFTIDRKLYHLTRGALYQGHGFYLRCDNFIEKLPMFVAATFPYDKWYKTDVYSKSYDGNGTYIQDKDFLKKCLLYTLLTYKNKCRSLHGSDGRFYQNELCLDGDTIGAKTLQQFELTKEEERLIKYFNDVLFEAKDTEEYNNEFNYNLWQIMEEINIKIPSGVKDKYGKDKLVRKYPKLNTVIETLKKETEQYYQTSIVSDLFKYQLLK